MKKTLAVLALQLLAGCLTAPTSEVSHWMLAYRPGRQAPASPKYGVARVAHVSLRAPCRARGITVLRADGTVALDPYNEYVAEPAQLLRGVVADALEGSGLFSSVIAATSLAKAAVSVEVGVQSLVLDCRAGDPGKRTAFAELTVMMVDATGGILTVEKGVGSAPAADAKYGEALSLALSRALEQAIGRLN